MLLSSVVYSLACNIMDSISFPHVEIIFDNVLLDGGGGGGGGGSGINVIISVT